MDLNVALWTMVGSVLVALIGALFGGYQQRKAAELRDEIQKQKDQQDQAALTAVKLKEIEVSQDAATYTSWQIEVASVRDEMKLARQEILAMHDRWMEQAKQVARQEGEIARLQARLDVLLEERDRLKAEAEHLRNRVHELEPLQTRVKELQTEVNMLKAILAQRRATDPEAGRRSTDGGHA